MSARVIYTFVLVFVVLESVEPTTTLKTTTERTKKPDFSVAATLADFVNRVGKEFRTSFLSINYNSATVDPTYVNEFLVELLQGYFSNRTQVVGTELSRMQQSNVINVNTLVVALVGNTTDELLKIMTLTMRGRRSCYSLFVLRHVGEYAEIETLFKFLWSKQFRRSIVVANNKDVFSMSSYPKLKILNVTLAPLQQYFLPKGKRWNFAGYKVRVPVQMDIPNIFWHRKPHNKTYYLDGLGGKLFRKFMDYINASMEAYPLFINGSDVLQMHQIVKLLREGSIEISPHLHTTDIREADIDYSYAYVITPRCFMMPLDNEISRNLYLLLPFKWSVWLLIIGLIIIIDFCFRVWLRYKKQQDSVIARTGGVGLIALCLILIIPNQAVKSFNAYKAICPRFLRFLLCYGIVVFCGAYLSQMYSSTLTSILTATLFRTPSVSEMDLMKHDKPIMILKEDEIPLFGSAKFDWDYKSRLVYATHEEFHQQRLTMNTSHIYPVSLRRWDFLNQQQQFLKRKRFWVSNICAGEFPLQFQMQSDSHFDKPLMYFLLRTHEAGLIDFWARDTFLKSLHSGYTQYFQDSEDFIDRDKIKGISVKALSPLFYLYGLGMTLSLIVFLTELGYTKMKAKLGKYFIRK